jgi:hypothetical protein
MKNEDTSAIAEFLAETDVVREWMVKPASAYAVAAMQAGIAWADREAEAMTEDAVLLLDDWKSSDHDALPLVRSGAASLKTDEPYNESILASVCNAAARSRWKVIVDEYRKAHHDKSLSKAIQMSQEGDENVIAFVRAVIDSDAHDKIDAIDVASVVLAMMRGDLLKVYAKNPIAIWARYTLPEELFAHIFVVQS